MASSTEQYAHEILSGQRGGAGAALLRCILRSAEPFYAGAMRLRNRMYDAGLLASVRLPRPVISVGNITAGGTGKTPLVQWLAATLRAAGRRPAILLRGYRRGRSEISDEATLLDESLNGGGQPPVMVRANPDRAAAAAALLREHPDVDVLVLDDGFQHRRVARDLDIVLVDATNPFGYGHVHPRGLLREPLSGLARAGALVLTRADQATAEQRSQIVAQMRYHAPAAPLLACRHVHAALRSAKGDRMPLDLLAGRMFFAFAGIANPAGLHQQLQKLPGRYAGARWLPDHHAYTPADLRELGRQAAATGADLMLTTEKDWVKLRQWPTAAPVYRLELAVEFEGDGAERLAALAQAIFAAEAESGRR